MTEFSAVPACLDLLEEYLEQLCLCAFRKDVFSAIRHLLHKEQVGAALAGQVPLCWPSVNRVLKSKHQPPKLASGNRLAVKSVHTLFSWLWEWKDGQFERKGWSDKPYRMLYQQSFSSLVGRSDSRRSRQAWLLRAPGPLATQLLVPVS